MRGAHGHRARLDADGAIRETAAAAAGDTRAQFLAKAGMLGGGLVGSAALLGPELAAAASARATSRSSTTR